MQLKRIEPKVPQRLPLKTASGITGRVRGWKWEQIRNVVLRRDDFLCCVCGEALAEEVDHIVPLHLGGRDNYENLQSICKACHVIKNEQEGVERGY